MGLIPALQVGKVDGNVITASDWNSNFTNIRDTVNASAAFKDTTNTFALAQTFSAGVNVSGTAALATVTVSATLGVTGAATLGSTLAVTSGITCATVAASGAISAGTFGVTGGSTLAAVTASGTATFNGLVQLGQQGATKRHSGGDAGATPAISWNNGNCQRWRLTANATPVFSNPQAGAWYVLELQQDGTGSRTVTWSGATIAWAAGSAPTLTTTANRKDVVVLYCVDEASTGTYLGSVFGQDFANTTA